ncbi:M48 family metalloprotease [Halomarina ordinaria]|uniref:M48 family metalloprotease n=1 Tax=Halomarina ordinaria TaxID=3033939 RepID=A0ABD5UB00_9EURY|nr:M48 family metalloprotease [Halomarina sp. PSRA2]
MDWSSDRRLQRRMVGSLALTLVGYAALLGGLYWLLPRSLALPAGALLVLALVVQVREADRIAYLLTRGIALSRETYPPVYDTVGRVARGADMPMPAVAVVPTEERNAFAAGTGKRTVVCVTLGLLKALDERELEAVVAHELAHLKNGDSTVLTVAAFPTAVALFLLSSAGSLARASTGSVLRFWFFGQALGLALLVAVVGAPLLLASLPGTLVLSRYREFAADRGAVAITGDPVGLAEALGTLYGAPRPPTADLRRVATFNAFCIVPTASLPAWLPSTHPPTAERIRRLGDLAREIEQA